MVSGTLYTYPGSRRAEKILITAAYSGADVKVAENFEYGKTNTSSDFLQKFPFGKVPAFEDSSNKLYLIESNAIARYVANEALLGGAALVDQALVNEYIEFAEAEVLPSACAWTFPTLGFRQYNKMETEKAQNHIKKVMTLLNNLLLSRTFLVGERITLADIALATSLTTLYVQVMDPKFREAYGNVNRWFLTVVNQPNYKKVVGEIKLCEKMATFDSKRYQELHPKAKKETKPKKESAPKKEAAPKQAAAAEPAELPKPKKIDYFADAPKSPFSFDEWKKMYKNNKGEVSHPWFVENYHPETLSLWYLKYKYNDENRLEFLANNLVNGMYQRLEDSQVRNNGFAITRVAKENDDSFFTISAIWLFRGPKTAFERNDNWNTDAEYFEQRKLDLNADADLIKKFIYNEGGEDDITYKDYV